MFSKPSHKKVVNILFKSDKAVSRILPRGSWWNYIACMQAYLESSYGFRNSLLDCHLPINVFTVMKSTMYPPQGQLLIQEMAPNVKSVSFDHSVHMPLLDEPINFTRELGRFLTA